MWQEDMVRELTAAKNGDRKKVIEGYMTLTGKSSQTLYRIAARHGFSSGRRKRADAGTCTLNDDQVNYIAALLKTSARENKGVIMDVETALMRAEDNNIIDPGTVSVSRMQSILKERGMNKQAINAPDPHIQMKSLHPNHVHVFDASVCIQYYIKGKKGLRIMRQDMFYKNKPQNFAKIKDKIVRYVLADHYSGVIWVKYYESPGENQFDAFDFLCSAWQGGKHEKFPFRGVPKFILMDAGAANTSGAMKELLKRMDIEIPESMPHNPRRQGAAEVVQNIVETKFESALKFHPAHTVEDLNAWALDWCVWFNATKKHTRHGRTRTEFWLKITSDQLREMPPMGIVQDCFTSLDKEGCKVNGMYAVRYNNNEYDLRCIPDIIPNLSRVDIIKRPLEWPNICVRYRKVEYLVTPIEKDDAGFRTDAPVIGEEFARMPDSITQKQKKIMDNLAYGEDPKKDAVPFGGQTMYGIHADKVNQTFIPRRGVEMDVDTGMDERRIPVMALLKKLSFITAVSGKLNRAIRERFGDSVPQREADRLIDMAAAGDLTPDAVAAADDSASAAGGER